MEFNQRFPVLSSIAMILWIGGLLLVIGGGLKLGSDIAESIKIHAQTGAKWTASEGLAILAGVGTLVWGLLTMASAEVIGVLFAIEKNTREATSGCAPSHTRTDQGPGGGWRAVPPLEVGKNVP